MAYLRPPHRLHAPLLVTLTFASFLVGGAPATAGLRPDPKPPPQPQPLPEPPPQTRVSPQPPAAQPPVPEPAPPVAARAPSRSAGTTQGPTEKTREARRAAKKARRAAKRAAARVRREQLAANSTAGRVTQPPATRRVTPLAFSDSQSNVGTVVLIAMVAIAASLLLFGFGLMPALAERWPAADRVLAEKGDVIVTTGFAILAASAAFLLVILIAGP
jgi:hypothetical protein